MKREFKDFIEDKDNLEQLKNNKDNSLGYHGVYSSNWRGNNSFVSKWKKLIDNINSASPSWKQTSGQNKYKEHRKLFGGLGWIKQNKDGSIELTNVGEMINSLVSRGDTKEFIRVCVAASNKNNNIENAKNNWPKSFGMTSPRTAIAQINSYKEGFIPNIDDTLTRFAFLNVDIFHDFLKQNHGVIPFEIQNTKEIKEIIGKFSTSKYPINTVLEFISLIDADEIYESEDDSNKGRRVLSTSTKIVRDLGEVMAVNKRSNRICEVCGNDSKQFESRSGGKYNEVHHLVPLGTLISDEEIEKYDKRKFMISLCPYHHKAIHNSINCDVVIKQAWEALGINDDIIGMSFEELKNKYK